MKEFPILVFSGRFCIVLKLYVSWKFGGNFLQDCLSVNFCVKLSELSWHYPTSPQICFAKLLLLLLLLFASVFSFHLSFQKFDIPLFIVLF